MLLLCFADVEWNLVTGSDRAKLNKDRKSFLCMLILLTFLPVIIKSAQNWVLLCRSIFFTQTTEIGAYLSDK